MREKLPNGSAQIIPDAAISDLSQEAIVLARKQYFEKNRKTEAEILSRDDIAFLNKAKIAIRGKITRSAILLWGRYAHENNIPTRIFKPDRGIGRRAEYHLRSRAVIDNADHAAAFWDGQSHGAKQASGYAQKKKLTVQLTLFSLAQGFENEPMLP